MPSSMQHFYSPYPAAAKYVCDIHARMMRGTMYSACDPHRCTEDRGSSAERYAPLRLTDRFCRILFFTRLAGAHGLLLRRKSCKPSVPADRRWASTSAIGPGTCRVTSAFRPTPRSRPLGKELRDLETLLISFPIRPYDFVAVDIHKQLSFAVE